MPIEPEKDRITRGPGAPPGNTNALKHGFYSSRFREIDITDLETHEFSGLQDEIDMLRVYIRRVLALADQAETLTDAVTLLRVLSLSTTSLTRLIKTNHLLGGDDKGSAMQLIRDAIQHFTENYLNEPYPDPSTPSDDW